MEVVAFIASCEKCSEREACESLPDEDLVAEAEGKLKALILAKILKAKIFDEWDGFQNFVRERTGVSFGAATLVIDEEKEWAVINPVVVSPILLAIRNGELLEILQDLSFRTRTLRELEENVEAILKRLGPKKIMRTNPEELFEILRKFLVEA